MTIRGNFHMKTTSRTLAAATLTVAIIFPRLSYADPNAPHIPPKFALSPREAPLPLGNGDLSLSSTPALLGTFPPAAVGLSAGRGLWKTGNVIPASGLGFIISGWILTGVGALNLLTLPLCFSGYEKETNNESFCLGATGGLAAVGLGVGIPFVILGYNKRKKYKSWESDQAMLHLERTRLVFLRGGAVANYTAHF